MSELASAIAGTPRDERLVVVARLVSMDPSGGRAVVSIAGSDEMALPYVAGTYTTGTGDETTPVPLVHVLRSASGRAELVLGPIGGPQPEEAPEAAASKVPPKPKPPPPPNTAAPAPRRITTVIRPQWSGTWRSIRGAWDRWNVDRYGGRTTLWQGNAFGSGPLTGLATYGSQITALGALAIESIRVTTPRADKAGSAVIQGSAQGSRPAGALTSTGDTVTSTGTGVDLTSSMREGFRTGSLRGLALVGSAYLAINGAGHPSGMALTVTYTRPA